jgi:hypothetical protein
VSSLLGTPRAEAPYHILDTLAAAGWWISIVADPKGIKVTATHSGSTVVEVTGPELAEVTLLVAAACARKSRVPEPAGAVEPQ